MKIALSQAVALIEQGHVVAVPTETVYGLAARVHDAEAVQEIFKIKGRPSDNPLIVHISRVSQLQHLVKKLPPHFAKLKKFWPGPLTLVMPVKKRAVHESVRAGLNTLAVRMPKHDLMLRLIDRVGPLAAPSGNRSGRPSPTSRQHVEADLGKKFPVLDGGICQRGVESTVIAVHEKNWELLRAGALSAEEIQRVLRLPQKIPSQKTVRSPGQKYRHYAPEARLVLCANADLLKKKLKSCDAVLGFSDSLHGRLPLISLGPKKSPKQNLRRLYACLRKLDAQSFSRVAVDTSFVKTGLGATLLERLHKAALR